MKLTRRGEIVRNILIAIVIYAGLVVADNITTPNQCKVDVSQMSQGCKDLLYP